MILAEGAGVDLSQWEYLESREQTINIGTGVTPICGPSNKRYGLIFVGNTTNQINVSTNSAMALTDGFQLSINNGILELYLPRAGSIVQRGWYGTQPGGIASKMCFVESMFS